MGPGPEVQMSVARRPVFALVCLALCVAPLPASATAAARRAAPTRVHKPPPVPVPEVDPLVAAAAERDALAARASELDAIQSVEASARWLSGQAWDSQDPWVHLMA